MDHMKTHKLVECLVKDQKKVRFLSDHRTAFKSYTLESTSLFRESVSFYWDNMFKPDAEVALSYAEAYLEGLVNLPAKNTTIVFRNGGSVIYGNITENGGRLQFRSYKVDKIVGNKKLVTVACPYAELIGIDGAEILYNYGTTVADTEKARKYAIDNISVMLAHLASLCALETSIYSISPRVVIPPKSELFWRKEPIGIHNKVILPKLDNIPLTGEKFDPRMAVRLHLRRGHLRRLSSGKNIWVNFCWVGHASQGTVNKHYEMA